MASCSHISERGIIVNIQSCCEWAVGRMTGERWRYCVGVTIDYLQLSRCGSSRIKNHHIIVANVINRHIKRLVDGSITLSRQCIRYFPPEIECSGLIVCISISSLDRKTSSTECAIETRLVHKYPISCWWWTAVVYFPLIINWIENLQFLY